MGSIAQTPFGLHRDWELNSIMAEVGLAPTEPWVRITFEVPSEVRDDLFEVQLYGAICRSYPEKGTASDLKALRGFAYYAVGTVVPPGTVPASEPYWIGVEVGRPTIVRLWYQRLRFGASPVYAQLITAPPRHRRGSIEGLHLKNSEEDRTRALAGARLLLKFPAGGRKRLEVDPWSGWRETAEEAIKLKKANPEYTWPQIAARLGMPSHSTLEKWVRRLRQAGQ